MSRMTVFIRADNAVGYVQAVICVDDWAAFELLGFVRSADDVAEREREREPANSNRGRSKK